MRCILQSDLVDADHVRVVADARLALELDAGRDDRRVAALHEAILDGCGNRVRDHLVDVLPLRAEDRVYAPTEVELTDNLLMRRVSNDSCFRTVTGYDLRRVAAVGRRDDSWDIELVSHLDRSVCDGARTALAVLEAALNEEVLVLEGIPRCALRCGSSWKQPQPDSHRKPSRRRA